MNNLENQEENNIESDNIYHVDKDNKVSSSMLNCTKNNINEIEYSVKYQNYKIKCDSDINLINIKSEQLSNSSAWNQPQPKSTSTSNEEEKSSDYKAKLKELNEVKVLLNNTKSLIDNYQLNKSKKELINIYGNENIYEILKKKNLEKKIKEKIIKNIFYDKLTEKIYLMNFKYKIKNVFNIHNLTNAGLKLTEILHQEKIINSSNISNSELKHFANAELPGSFIVAVNYLINSKYPEIKYNWIGNSLLPGNDSIGLPDYFNYYKKYKKNWLMSPTMNGDIMDIDNINFIKNYFNTNGKVDLYTSDAGIGLDYNEYNEQEFIEIKLKLAEIICCLVSLKDGGNMIIKLYTFFEKSTIDVLIILSNLFNTFKIIKPMTSKPANSEIYIIGINYIGYNKSEYIIDLFKNKIKNFNTNGFLSNVSINDITLFTNISKQIYYKQIIFINRNIYYFNKYYNNDKFINFNLLKEIYEKYILKLVNHYYDIYIESNNL